MLIGIALASFGGWFATNRSLEARIDDKTESLSSSNVEVIQRVSRLEEAVQTIKTDNQEIKGDIKQILRQTK